MLVPVILDFLTIPPLRKATMASEEKPRIHSVCSFACWRKVECGCNVVPQVSDGVLFSFLEEHLIKCECGRNEVIPFQFSLSSRNSHKSQQVSSPIRPCVSNCPSGRVTLYTTLPKTPCVGLQPGTVRNWSTCREMYCRCHHGISHLTSSFVLFSLTPGEEPCQMCTLNHGLLPARQHVIRPCRH